jgi:plasmid stability protein
MTSLTLHAIDDPLADALRRHAAETGTSLNQSAKALLARALGLDDAPARPEPSFMRFAGRLDRASAAKLRTAVENADFSRVDPADWA